MREFYLIDENITKSDWEARLRSLPNPHVLQTWEWGEFKGRYGWDMHPYLWVDNNGDVAAGAMCLRRYFSVLGKKDIFSVCYIPKGPVMDWRDTDLRNVVLRNLKDRVMCTSDIFIKIDPDIIVGIGEPEKDNSNNNRVDNIGDRVTKQLINDNWIYSKEQVQYKNTIAVDLTPPEAQLLANMKQKTRYNIRIAEKNGVTVRRSSEADLEILFRMYAETSVRNGFTIRNREYYLSLWSIFISAGLACPLVAYVDDELVAGLILFIYHKTAWYLYGMSLEKHRDKMPNYLLQWEAMKYAKSLDCIRYDFWGAPDEFTDQDPMFGVYRFKSGFGGDVIRHIGAWDYPARKFFYKAYTEFVPKVLDLYRKKGFAETSEYAK